METLTTQRSLCVKHLRTTINQLRALALCDRLDDVPSKRSRSLIARCLLLVK